MRSILLLPLLAVAIGCPAPVPARGADPQPEAQRPFRGGRTFISPMGEPFRADERGDDLIGRWFAGADANHDGAIDLAEMEADAARFYATLDINHDGEIDPGEIERYETEIAPEIHQLGAGGGFGGGGGRSGGRGGGHGGRGGGMGGHGGGMGGGRGGFGGGGHRDGGDGAAREGRRGGFGGRAISLLDLPEPVTAADYNFNRGISAAEFKQAADQRFVALDANHDGRIQASELVPFRPQRPPTPAANVPKVED